MDAQDREKVQQQAIEKMLGQALRRTSRPGGEACPAPDLHAAYLEQTLSLVEKENFEAHLSECAPCQEVLAALAATALEPALAEEFVMAAASAMPAARPHAARDLETARAPALHAPAATTAARTSWFTLHWRWFTPAVSLAAVAALWFAIGQPFHRPEAVRVAQSNPTTSAPLPPAPETPPRVEADRIAKNLEVPPPRSRERSQILQRKTTALDALANAPANSSKSHSAGHAVGGAAASSAPPPKPGPVSPASAEPPRVLSSERDEARKPAEEKKESQGTPSGMVGAAANTVVVAPTPQGTPSADQKMKQAPAESSQTVQVVEPASGMAGGLALRERAAASQTFRKAALFTPHTIATPDPLILWRAGLTGKIERSEDGGKTWQTQSSGVTANLTSGSAPSAKVCWVAGAVGVILRTTDGEHWEKIASPGLFNWTRIVAEDAQRAIITSADQKQYVTTDGGKTWMPQ
jgi:hypothetical protein